MFYLYIPFKTIFVKLAAYHKVPVRVDAVSQSGDEQSEVARGQKEGGDGNKHHPALEQRDGHIGGCHQDPYQTSE